MASKCKHPIILCNRRVTGYEKWFFYPGEDEPFELWGFPKLVRSKPKTGICDDCKKRVAIPYAMKHDKSGSGK